MSPEETSTGEGTEEVESTSLGSTPESAGSSEAPQTESTEASDPSPDLPAETAPQKSYGIQETRDVVKLGACVAKALVGALEDGKLGLSDLIHLVPVGKALPAAIKGISQVPAELKDLSEKESAELNRFIEGYTGDCKSEKAAESIMLAGIHIARAVFELTKK